MIERLSDAVLADIKANTSNGGMSTEDGIRAFYDVQIDAQAKTMFDLWNAFCDATKSGKANEWALKRSDKITVDERLLFAEAVGFFLAAGGTIKE